MSRGFKATRRLVGAEPPAPERGVEEYAESDMPINASIIRQFYRPAGLLGVVVGWIMASRDSNVERLQWTVSLLGIKDGDRVLELGFGPGVAIGMSAAAAGPKGRVVGIDHSTVMFAQATRRNK